MLRLFNIGVWFTALGLVFLGLHTLVVPELAAQGYGLGLSGDAPGWMLAAGARDLALGLALLTQRKRPQVLLPLLLCTAVVPLSDVLIVWRETGVLAQTAPHLTGLVGILVLCVMCWRKRGHRVVAEPPESAG